MGNTSPRKKGAGIGELGMDGGASYRTENGMRRTKRLVPRPPANSPALPLGVEQTYNAKSIAQAMLASWASKSSLAATGTV